MGMLERGERLIGQSIDMRGEETNCGLFKVHRKALIENLGESFTISLVAHDGMFTMIGRVNSCRVSLKG